MTSDTSKAPERIWLQLDLIARQPVEDATWCQDRIEDWDTEYVRRDLFAAMQARAEKAEAENERLRAALRALAEAGQ